MGENPELLAGGQPLPRMLSHRRILFEMAVIVLLAAAASLIFVSARFSLGVLVGGILSFVNYFWLKQSTKAIFENAIAGKKPVFLSIKYILRYVLIGAVVALFYFTDALPVVAVILGLAGFAFAVVLDGLLGIFTSSSEKEV